MTRKIGDSNYFIVIFWLSYYVEIFYIFLNMLMQIFKLYLVPFFSQMPKLLWTGSNIEDGEYLYSWSAKEIWSMEDGPYFMMDFTSNSTFNNWITDLGFLCISDFQLGLFGSFNIAGYAFGAIALLRLGDIFGRKPVIVVCWIFNIAIYLLMFWIDNIFICYYYDLIIV